MNNPSDDRKAIEALIEEQAQAMCSKNLDRLLACYLDDAVMFDVKPPIRCVGLEVWRNLWEQCIPYLPDTLGCERRDVVIHIGEGIAFSHWLWRFTGMDMDHEATRAWMRWSSGYLKVGGRWKIAHEHYSFPFHPETGQTAFISEP